MITREEVIEICNKLGLVEYTAPELEDYRPWKFSSSLFKTPTSSTIVVLSKNPYDKITRNRLYFYHKLKYRKDVGFTINCEDNFFGLLYKKW